MTLALALQSVTAEALAALWAGKLESDPLVMVAWNRINLDRKGRRDLAAEQDRSWDRIHEIHAEAANRMTITKEEGTTYVVTSLGYERSRNSPPEPLEIGEPRPKKDSG